MNKKNTSKYTLDSSMLDHEKNLKRYDQVFHIDPIYIPSIGSKSRLVFDLLISGVTRIKISNTVRHYHGAPLEDLEGKRYGYWLIDRYVDEHGDKCLKLNERHLLGCNLLDSEARAIRRKKRAKRCLKKNKKEIGRSLIVQFENNEAKKEYFFLFGEAANDSEERTQIGS